MEPESSDGAALISDDLLCDVVRMVLSHGSGQHQLVLAEDATTASIVAERLEDLGIDSFTVAEIVVVLEQRLGTLLEVAAGGRVQTVGDLRRVLQPMES